MSSVVTDIMEEVYPVLERVCVVLEAAKQAQASSKQGLRDAVAQAESQLVPILYSAVDQLDIFLEDAAKSVGASLAPGSISSEVIRKAKGQSSAPTGVPRPEATRSAAKARTPRHVIRGSGSQNKGG